MSTSAAASTTDATTNARIPASVVAEYRAIRPLSAALYERALATFPGAETRAVTHFWPHPTVLRTGAGSRLVDVDGNTYIDLVNNYTSLIHGNAFEPIADATTPTLRTGTVFASLHEKQLELGEAIAARVPSIELLRFTNSGSEASALALRIARRVTGRRDIVVATGSYHGAVAPFTPGEPEVRVTPYNDIEALDSSITERTAAVFMEPFLGAGGVIEGDPAFLLAVQNRARAVGAIFVLDEIQSLRNAPNGAQGALGLQPDLTTLAKIIGGGLPIGAVGGRAELLEVTSPLLPGRLDHAGTFNGHVTAAAAGLVSLQHFGPEEIAALNTKGAWLAEKITAAGHAVGVPVTVTRAGSILNVHPGPDPVTLPAHARRGGAFRSALHLALLIEGLYTTPRSMINLSTALSQADLDDAVSAYSRALERLAPSVQELLHGEMDGAA